MPVTLPSDQQNVTWPVTRGPRGWERVTLAKRFASALRFLLQCTQGTLPWAPYCGTTLYRLRTQPIQDGDEELVAAELSMAISAWIPDITLMGVELEQNPGDFLVVVRVTWMLPSVTPGSKEPILKPRTTAVEI